MTLRIFSTVTYRKLLGLQGLLAAATLAMALAGQYGFHLHPCELCLMQRYPYGAVMLVAAIFMLVKSPAWQFRAVIFCVLLFALDAGIAFYHTGVELDIFQGPDACSAGNSGEQTLEEMRAAIMNAPLVSCKQAMAYFFGLSMAAWNGLAASLYILVSIAGCWHVRRR